MSQKHWGLPLLFHNECSWFFYVYCQAWNFIFERARPFSFCQGQFYWKIERSMGNDWRGTKAKTRGNRSCGLRVNPGLHLPVLVHETFSLWLNVPSEGQTNYGKASCSRIQVSWPGLEPTLWHVCCSDVRELESSALKELGQDMPLAADLWLERWKRL